MASESFVLQNCLDHAADDAQSSFARCVDNTVKAIQDAEGKSITSARRNELTIAWRTLANQRDALARIYPDLLRAAFRAEASTALKQAENPNATTFEETRPPSDKPFDPFGDDDSDFGDREFSLVDDTQLSQSIEVSRLLQRLSGILEPSMLVVDGLVSSALGLPHIAPTLNPLRADVFARVVRRVLEEAKAESTTVTVWLAFIAPPLGEEIKDIYSRLIKDLKAAGVQAVKYKVGQSPDSPTGPAASAGAGGAEGGADSGHGGLGGGGGGGGTGGGGGGFGGVGGGSGGGGDTGNGAGGGGAGGGYGGWGPGGFASSYVGEPVVVDMADEEVSGELLRQFFVNPSTPIAGTAPRVLPPSFYAAVDQELAQIRDEMDTEVLPDSPENYRDIPPVERPARYVDASMALNSPMWGEFARAKERALVRTSLKKEAQYVDQVLGLEMVQQLVNQVARDARLLGAMREAIIALEPALLRLAMIDPRFFTDASHPGRRLIERVAQRSFRYNDELGEDFGKFYEPVGSAFNALNHLQDVADSKPYEAALEKLESLWSEQDQAEATARNAVLVAMRFAEERQALANQLAYEISQRTDLDLVPAVVLDFLYNRWTLVMAHARLKDTKNQMDPGGYGSLISDLLWSSKHDLTLNNPVKLIQLIPPMLRTINEGLEMLGQDASEKQQIFDTLERLHKPVLELCRTRNRKEWAKDGFQDTRPAPPEAPATAEERVAKPAAQPWIGKKAMQEVGFEDPLATPSEMPDSMYDSSSFDSSSLPLDAAAEGPEGGPPAVDGEPRASAEDLAAAAQLTAAQIIKGLRLGGWVDLYSQETWLRAQLIWASTRRTLFMFESRANRPHSMTRRSCERLIRTRQLRPVDMQEVVARALQAIAREAAGEDLPLPETAAAPDSGSAPLMDAAGGPAAEQELKLSN